MERLTHYETPEKHAYVDRRLVSLGWYSMANEGFRGPAIDRLAAYEDTGFTPEAIITMRGELCLKCGRYTDAHLGACNGCRWRKEA